MSLVKNVGSTDQAIRIVAGLVLIGLAFLKLGGFASTAGIVSTVVGVVLIATAVINFCPAYRLLGLRTTKSTN